MWSTSIVSLRFLLERFSGGFKADVQISNFTKVPT